MTNEQNYQESNSTEMTFISFSNGNKLKKPMLASESDTIKTWIANYKKTIEEVIAEDNKIIESDIDNNANLDLESTIKDVIKEDNQIIESNITNGLLSLNYKIIFSTTPFLTLTLLEIRHYRK